MATLFVSRRSVQSFTLSLTLTLVLASAPSQAQWSFSDATATAGLTAEHGLEFGFFGEPCMMSGGAASADIDGDGDLDLFLSRGDLHPGALFRNRGNGTFEEVGASLGLAITGGIPNGALFADFDGNGAPDLFVGGVMDTAPRIFLNDGTGHFTNSTATSGLTTDGRDTFSAAAADIDHDGDLDLFLGHWSRAGGGRGHLWTNDGHGHFTDVSLTQFGDTFRNIDWTFTPNFADTNNDRWPDLLLAADFNTSRTFRNRQDGTFEETTNEAVLTDENGMGAAVGDVDNDGDLDWFVSSIFDVDGVAEGNWGLTGNRLYKNRGDGTFDDATEASGVRIGYWGWGSCMQDFDNDGHLDIFHVNGFPVIPAAQFHADPARFFVGDGDGTFTERSAELGIVSTEQGRGVVCFDVERDGDLDLFIQNNTGAVRFFRNDLTNGNHWLTVRLVGGNGNVFGIGARVSIRTALGTQIREISAGSNYLSSNPSEAHFGLGAATTVLELEVLWPDGTRTTASNVAVDRVLDVPPGGIAPPPSVTEIPTVSTWGLLLLAFVLAALAAFRLSGQRVARLLAIFILVASAVSAFAAEKTVEVTAAEREAARAELERAGLAFTPENFLALVAKGDAGTVATFVRAGIDPTSADGRRRTALWIAVERRQLATLKTLLASGVAPTGANAPVLEYGKTLVFEAVDTGEAEYVEVLAQAGADAKAANEYGVPPLAEAARVGNLAMCKALITAGADPNHTPGGFPLLFGPVVEGHLDIVRFLIEKGAKLGASKQDLLDAAKSEEMKALLSANE